MQFRGVVLFAKSDALDMEGTSYLRHDAVIVYNKAHVMMMELLFTFYCGHCVHN